MPRAVDAGFAGLVLVADDDEVHDGVAGDAHDSLDPSRKLFDISASGAGWAADVQRAREYGALATAAQLIGAGQAMLDASVAYAKQRSQFGRLIGSYQAIKHKLADVHIALELARPLVYGAALSLGANAPETARDVSAAKVAAAEAGLLAARSALQTHGAIGFTQEHDLGLLLLRAQALRSAWGDPTRTADVSWRRCDRERRCAAGVRLQGRTSGEERAHESARRTKNDLLAQTVRDLVGKHAGPEAVRVAMESERGYDETLWKLLSSRSASRPWWCPRSSAGPAVNSRTPPPSSGTRRPGPHAAAGNDYGRTRAAGRR